MGKFCGGATTLEGDLSSPTTLGGETPRSMMVTVSSAGFGGIVFTPLTSTALASLAETASCAAASDGNNGTMRRAATAALRESELIYVSLGSWLCENSSG